MKDEIDQSRPASSRESVQRSLLDSMRLIGVIVSLSFQNDKSPCARRWITGVWPIVWKGSSLSCHGQDLSSFRRPRSIATFLQSDEDYHIPNPVRRLNGHSIHGEIESERAATYGSFYWTMLSDHVTCLAPGGRRSNACLSLREPASQQAIPTSNRCSACEFTTICLGGTGSGTLDGLFTLDHHPNTELTLAVRPLSSLYIAER